MADPPPPDFPPPGWYKDPEGPSQRYWDGQAWTDNRAPIPESNGSSGAGIGIGLFAMVVGIAAIVVSQRYKLDSDLLLTGGSYLKDEFVTMLLIGGGLSALLGLAALIQSANETLRAWAGVIAVMTAIGVVIALLAVNSQDDETSDIGVQSGLQA